MGVRGEVFSVRCSGSGDNRSYFFNVKENRNGDLFLNIVESKKHGGSDFERHQIVVFAEDLQEFRGSLEKCVEFMRNPKEGGRPEPNRDRGSREYGERSGGERGGGGGYGGGRDSSRSDSRGDRSSSDRGARGGYGGERGGERGGRGGYGGERGGERGARGGYGGERGGERGARGGYSGGRDSSRSDSRGDSRGYGGERSDRGGSGAHSDRSGRGGYGSGRDSRNDRVERPGVPGGNRKPGSADFAGPGGPRSGERPVRVFTRKTKGTDSKGDKPHKPRKESGSYEQNNGASPQENHNSDD